MDIDRDAAMSWRYLCQKYTRDEIDEFIEKGWAMPDGSFPIGEPGDVELCIGALLFAKPAIATKRHICRRAGELKVETPLGFCGP